MCIGIDSGSPEQEARDRLSDIGFAETERRIGELSKVVREAALHLYSRQDMDRVREMARKLIKPNEDGYI